MPLPYPNCGVPVESFPCAPREDRTGLSLLITYMKRLLVFGLTLGLASTALAAPSGKMVIVNGTAIDPGSSKVISNAAVIIEGDHITSIVQNSKEMPMKGDGVIDATGKFILPGYIDTHVHFFQSGDIYTRPDAVDLNSIRSYKDE